MKNLKLLIFAPASFVKTSDGQGVFFAHSLAWPKPLQRGEGPPIPSPFDFAQDEGRIPFELFLEYTASWENANLERKARGAERAASIGFERAFLAKRKRIY